MNKFENILFDLYCNDIITKEELKERFDRIQVSITPSIKSDEKFAEEHSKKEKEAYKKNIERYFALYLDERISKGDLIDILNEE